MRGINGWNKGPVKARDQGFTLIEIMASIVILSAVGLALSGFFIHAMSYSKHNQSKTIAVHLARNALAYIQKEKYQSLRDYLTEKNAAGEFRVISQAACGNGLADCQSLAANIQALQYVLSPTVNGVPYAVTIRYEDKLSPGLALKPDEQDELAAGNPAAGLEAAPGSGTESSLSQYLLPVVVIVSPQETEGTRDSVEVEGYLTDETIR